jgi:hypothetical protein
VVREKIREYKKEEWRGRGWGIISSVITVRVRIRGKNSESESK